MAPTARFASVLLAAAAACATVGLSQARVQPHRRWTGRVHAETVIPASSPSILYQGRTAVNKDGSRSFDWEGVQATLYVKDASYVIVQVNASANTLTRLRAYVDGVEASTVYVTQGVTEYVVAAGIPSGSHNVRVYNLLEPAVEDTPGHGPLTLLGFATDGTADTAPAPSTRNIQYLGDSITVGMCSRTPRLYVTMCIIIPREAA
jgi:opacity protein-like surface antigen